MFVQCFDLVLVQLVKCLGCPDSSPKKTLKKNLSVATTLFWCKMFKGNPLNALRYLHLTPPNEMTQSADNQLYKFCTFFLDIFQNYKEPIILEYNKVWNSWVLIPISSLKNQLWKRMSHRQKMYYFFFIYSSIHSNFIS